MNQNFRSDKIGWVINMKNGYHVNLNIAYSTQPLSRKWKGENWVSKNFHMKDLN